MGASLGPTPGNDVQRARVERLPAFFVLWDGAVGRGVLVAARFFTPPLFVARFAAVGVARAATFGRAPAAFAADGRFAGAAPAVFADARAGARVRPARWAPLALTSGAASSGSALLRRFGACAR